MKNYHFKKTLLIAMTQFLIVATFRIKFGAKQVYSAWFDYRFDYLLETSVCRLDVISTDLGNLTK